MTAHTTPPPPLIKEDHPLDEQLKLFAVANMMNILFNYVPAKKNKGLILQVCLSMFLPKRLMFFKI